MEPQSEKLDDLTKRIDLAQKQARPDAPAEDKGAGRNVGFDFVGAIAGGGIIGALLDRAFGTSPWCLLGMVLFGFVTGMYSAWRAIKK